MGLNWPGFSVVSPARTGAAGGKGGVGSSSGDDDGASSSAPLLGAKGKGVSSSDWPPVPPPPTTPAVSTPRPKSKLANVSGFYDAPPQAVQPPTRRSLPQRFWSNGLACCFTASLIFSISAFCVKLMQGRVPVLELCLVRSALSFSMSIVLMQGMGMRPMFGHRCNAPLLAVRGIFGAVGMMLYYTSLQMLPLGDAVTIGLIQPPITAVAARLVLGEPLGARGVVGAIVSLAGVVLIAQPPFLFGSEGGQGGSSERMMGAALGMGAAALSSGSYLAIRKLGSAEKAPVVAMAFHTATVAITCGPLVLGFPTPAKLPSANDAGLLVAVAATSFVAQLLMTRALQCTAAARVSAMSFTQVLYSYALSALVFHERMSGTSAAGVLLTLFGVAAVVLRHGPKTVPAATTTSLLSPGKVMVPTAVSASSGEGVVASPPPKRAGPPPGPAVGEEQVDTGAGELGRSYTRQRTLRPLASVRRLSRNISTFIIDSSAAAAASAVAAAPITLLRQLSVSANAQLESAPSMSAAELAVAAEGTCSACVAALAAANAALEAFSRDDGAVDSGGDPLHADTGGNRQGEPNKLLAANAAAEAVAAAFGGEEFTVGSSSERAAIGLIPVAMQEGETQVFSQESESNELAVMQRLGPDGASPRAASRLPAGGLSGAEGS